jgi:dihydroorotate dehydrogenase electron transfer subunit
LSRYFRAEVAENRALNRDYCLLTFVPSEETPEPEPGQFYMVGKSAGESGRSAENSFDKNTYDPLLKRPFSLFRKTSRGLQILYRIRGKGTMMMRDMKKGSLIHVLGPLGNSYPMPPKDHAPLIVAGGVGVVSLFSLAERLAAMKNKAEIYYGARGESDLLMTAGLKKVAKRLSLTTDDGSCGERGCITDMLSDSFVDAASADRNTVIYACGPRPMLAALKGIVKDKGIPTYVSMEENMACGIGACLGCVVKTVNGNKRVCKEGPVFDISEIVW